MPNINVPGIGEVFADGFAEEATMLRILQVLGDSNNANSPEAQQKLAASASTASNNLTGLQKATAYAGQSLRSSSQAASEALFGAGDSTRRFSRDMNIAGRSLQRSFSSIGQQPFGLVSGLTDMIANAGENAGPIMNRVLGGVIGGATGAMISDLFGAEGPLAIGLSTAGGAALGALAPGVMATVGPAIAGFLFDKLNSTSEAFFKIQNAGALLGGSMIETRVNSHAANLTMAEFSNVMGKNSEAMASFGGQTRRGAREFARANQAVTNTFGNELLGLGIGFEDMGMATAEMMQNFQLSGISAQEVAVRTDEFAAAVRNNLVQQKAMAAITGRSLEQQKEAERQQRKDAVVQASLARMQPEQRAEMERLISAFPHLREAILDQAVFGTATSAEALRQFSAFPIAMEGITQAVDNVSSGAGGAADAFILAAKNSDAIREENLQAADMIATLGRFTSNSMIKTMQDSFLPMQELMTRSINKTVVDVTNDLVTATTEQDKATKALIELIQANRKLSMSMSSASTGLLAETEGMVGVISSTTSTIADVVNKFANSMGIQTQTNVGVYNTEVSTQAVRDAVTSQQGNDSDTSSNNTQNTTTNTNNQTPPSTGNTAGTTTDPNASSTTLANQQATVDALNAIQKNTAKTNDLFNQYINMSP